MTKNFTSTILSLPDANSESFFGHLTSRATQSVVTCSVWCYVHCNIKT